MHVFIKIIAQHHHRTHAWHREAIGGLSPTIPPSWSAPDWPALTVAASALSLVISFHCLVMSFLSVCSHQAQPWLGKSFHPLHLTPHSSTQRETPLASDERRGINSKRFKYLNEVQVQAPQKVSKKWQIKAESYLTPNLIFPHQGLSHVRSFISSLNKYLLGTTMWAPGLRLTPFVGFLHLSGILVLFFSLEM